MTGGRIALIVLSPKQDRWNFPWQHLLKIIQNQSTKDSYTMLAMKEQHAYYLMINFYDLKFSNPPHSEMIHCK